MSELDLRRSDTASQQRAHGRARGHRRAHARRRVRPSHARHGLTADNLRAADLVTADGESIGWTQKTSQSSFGALVVAAATSESPPPRIRPASSRTDSARGPIYWPLDEARRSSGSTRVRAEAPTTWSDDHGALRSAASVPLHQPVRQYCARSSPGLGRRDRRGIARSRRSWPSALRSVISFARPLPAAAVLAGRGRRAWQPRVLEVASPVRSLR